MNRLILVFFAILLLTVLFGCGQFSPVDTSTPAPISLPLANNDSISPEGTNVATSENPAPGPLPRAHIDSISPGEATEGQRITFRGHGTPQGGDIVAYSWRSSLDGDLNTQPKFTTPKLSVGEHIIYFKVQDNNGMWSDEDTKKVNILNAIPSDTDVTVTASLYKITNIKISGPAGIVSCSFPLTLDFSGLITTDGPCTVDYQWERSDDVVSPKQSIITYVPCTSSVTYSFPVTKAGNYRVRLHTLTPTEMFSPYFFVSVTCIDGVITDVTSTSVSTSGINDCPVTVYFSYSITMDGPGTVTYLWLRSDGIATPTYDLAFAAACTQTLSYTWQINSSGTYWVRLHTIKPNIMETTNYLPVSPHCG